jgi:hypothetical protein
VNTRAMVAGLLMWLALFGVAVAVLAVTALVSAWQRRAAQPKLDPLDPEPPWKLRQMRVSVQDFTQLLDGVDELSRQAVAATAAAQVAAAEADAARIASLASQQAREKAWYEYDTAQQAYSAVLRRSRSTGPGVWPLPAPDRAWPVLLAHRPRVGPLTIDPMRLGPILVAGGSSAAIRRPSAVPAPRRPGPEGSTGPRAGGGADPDGLRDVQRAALAAYRRGDLDTEQLRAVYAKVSGGDGAREQHERDVHRRLAAEREAHRRFAAAATAERRAYEAADIAVVAAHALAEEAATANEEARRARVFAEECVRQAGGRRQLRTSARR